MDERIQQAAEKMSKSLESLSYEFTTIRVGRASPAVLEKVAVDYYGSPTPINQMAAVSVPDAKTLLIQPWDKSTLKEIEKAILSSDVGITPMNDGTVIRLSFPPLTEERRKEIVKTVHKYGEECKISIRNVRRDFNDQFKTDKKNSVITEDDLKDLDKSLQNQTDKACEEVDKLVKAKEKEIMEI